MRNKTSSRSGLFLMELIIAILFFSLAGAVCVRLFVNSHIISRQSVELNYALAWSQNVAEAFYGCNGDRTEMAALFENVRYDVEADHEGNIDGFTLFYNEDFQPLDFYKDTKQTAAYQVTVRFSSEGQIIHCQIQTERLANTQEARTEPIYALSVSLFPEKEATHEK